MSETYGTDDPLGGKLTVLVVDDDPTSCALTGQILETLGYHVISAQNGEEGLLRFEERRPDLVISDLMMPIMDGAEMMQKIKADNPTVPVVIMTVVDSADQAVSLIKSGADDYLTKPVDLDEAEAAILDAVGPADGKAARTEDITANLPPGFVCESPAMRHVIETVAVVAPSGAPVLVMGESGVGKEVVAQLIHRWSPRRDGPLVDREDCAMA